MSSEQPTILLVGLGHLGGVLLELLAREEWIGRIVACARNRSRGEARCNLARMSAAAQGLAPWIEFRQTDIAQTDRFAETVDTVRPWLILGTATLQTWWLPDLLPARAREEIRRARFGIWLPLHLAPTHAFMRGVRASSFAGPVLTAPFPDVVNCILGKVGLAPTCGIGNVDEIAAKIRWLASERLQEPPESVHVDLVAHHALEAAAFGGSRKDAPPFFLRVLHKGIDVTEEVGGQELLFTPYPLPKGPTTAFFTAGSTVRLLRALHGDTPTSLHAPAPRGLPGGYPVLVARGRVDLASVPGLDPGRSIEINERSHPFDGIDSVEADGTAVLRPKSADILRRELGYDCPRLSVDEAPARGLELTRRFKEYAARQGVRFDSLP